MLKEWRVIIKLFTGKQRVTLSFLVLCTLIGSALETAGILLIAPIVQLIQDPHAIGEKKYLHYISGIFNVRSAQGLLTFFLLATAIFYIVKSLFLGLLAWYQNRFIYNVKYSLTNKLLFTYLHQPWPFYFSRSTALLLRNINLDMIIFTETVKAWIILFAESFFVLTICLVLFVYQPGAMAILLLACGPVLWLFNRISNNILKKGKKERHFSEGEKLKYLKQGFDGIKDIIINGNEDFFLSSFKSPNYAEVKATRQFMMFMQFPKLWLESLTMIALTALLGISLSNGNSMALLPFMALLVISLFKILPSITRIVTSFQTVLYNEKSTECVYNDLCLEKNIPVKKHSASLDFNSAITIKNVFFSYPTPGTLILENVNVTIPKGSITGIVGKTGSGKSTFIDVLVGLLDPTAGTIYADGINIQTDLAAWKCKISYVPQTVYLFDDSIRNNIALGIQPENINDDDILSVIVLAQLDEFIATLPEGIDTKVGDAGIRLSGGQRQRVGIARALYKNSDILVLDEATNALDVETEKKILTNIHSSGNKKTVITISHRMASLANCDKIYKIENGNLSEYKVTDEDHINV